MSKHKPVPRTLSEIMRTLSDNTIETTELVSPEELKKTGEVPFIDPKVLFENATLRPPENRPTAMRDPEEIFGKEALAESGEKLLSLDDLLKSKDKKNKGQTQ